MASLQNSVPLQATVPRANEDPPTRKPIASSSFAKRVGVDGGHIHDQQVLHVGGAQFAGGKPLGKIGGAAHLVGGDSSAQSNRSDVGETQLLLRVNADVIAIDVVGRMLFHRWVELESDAILQFVEKTLGRPSVAQEEKLQAGALAMFAQHVGIAEQFGNSLDRLAEPDSTERTRSDGRRDKVRSKVRRQLAVRSQLQACR